MSKRRRIAIQKQVDPRVAGIAILIVLAIVQYVWWQGLVARRRGQRPGGPSAMQMPPGEISVVGWQDAMVVTLAGDPEPGDADGPGRDARFDGPCGIALDSSGSVYVSDCRNHRIRKMTPDGRTSTLAGGEAGYRDGPADQAQFNGPSGIAVDSDGTVYVADTGNHRIRMIRDGRVTTVAGGECGFADGTGAAARFNLPTALLLKPSRVKMTGSVLLIADTGNQRIRGLYPQSGIVGGHPGKDGAATALASVGGNAHFNDEPIAAAIPYPGAIRVGATALSSFLIDIGDQRPPPDRAKWSVQHPLTLAAAPGPKPNAWFAVDAEHGAVLLLHDGIAELIAGPFRPAYPMNGFRDEHGNRASLGQIGGMAYDGRGTLYVSDSTNNCIRRITIPMAHLERALTH